MQQTHGHSPEEIAARLEQGNANEYLKDLIYGGIDGAVTTFAIVAGVAGAGLSHDVIVILGLANILADGFSMAASNYSGTKAVADDRNRIIEIERSHIKHHRDGELEELRQILAKRGLRGDVLQSATDAIAEDEDNWIGLMLTDEYGLSRDAPQPLHAAIATFVAFMIAGAIPLMPFVLGLPSAFVIATISTLIVFFLIGTGKSRWSLARWWWSGTETLLIGASAALIAFVVGGLLNVG